MKILVPTDFSNYAQYALDAAILLSHKLIAEIHIVHIIEDDGSFSDHALEDTRKQTDERTKNRLNELVHQVSEQGITSQSYVLHGKFIETFADFIGQAEYDLVVMGSHGASGKREWFIGSNAQKVIRSLHQNVFIVKQKFDKIDFSKVLFVTGLDQKDQQALKYFLDFIRPFDVKEVHIMAVDTSSYFSQPTSLMLEVLKDFKEIAKEFEVQTHFYDAYSVDEGVRHFCKENGVDLVAMSNHIRHPIKRIFQGSNVEIVVNHSPVPVLSIDYGSQ